MQKSGIKTTEFWLTLLFSLGVIVPVGEILLTGLESYAKLFPGNQFFAIAALLVGALLAALKAVTHYASERRRLKIDIRTTNVPRVLGGYQPESSEGPENPPQSGSGVQGGPGVGPGAAGLVVLIALFSQGCAHSLQAPKVAKTYALSGPTDVTTANALKRCDALDNCYLICSTATPVLAGLGGASGLLSLIGNFSPIVDRNIRIAAVISGSLAAGTSTCAQQCQALHTDRCTTGD